MRGFWFVVALVGLSGSAWADPKFPPGVQIGGPINTNTVTATGDTGLRALASRLADPGINILGQGNGSTAVDKTGVTDVSYALTQAVTIANNRLAAAIIPSCVWIPAGTYLLKSPPPTFAGGGCVQGAGRGQTIINLDTTFSGDTFSFSERGAGPYADPTVRDLTVNGTRSAAGMQNGIAIYDRSDQAHIENVELLTIPGRALYLGAAKTVTQGWLAEAHLTNNTVASSGAVGIPSVELTSQCTVSCTGTDASNEVDFNALRIYGSYGAGFIIRNANTAATGVLRQIRINKLVLEGNEGNPTGATADLLQIGDSSMAGVVRSISCEDCEFTSPYTGYSDVHILANASSAAMPSFINIEGKFITGAGGGGAIKIDQGNNIFFKIPQMASAGVNLTVGPSAGGAISAPIVIDGGGYEYRYTTAIDSTSSALVYNPLLKTTANFSLQVPDSTPAGGNARGASAVDLSTSRTAANQVASGPASFNGPGQSEASTGSFSYAFGNTVTATANFASAIGNSVFTNGFAAWGFGSNVSIGGPYSVGYGLYVNDRNRFAWNGFASGEFSVLGDAQYGTSILRGIGASTTSIRLTSDGGTAGAANIDNIPDAAHYELRVSLHARDVTTPANSYAWTMPIAILTRGTGVATTALTIGTASTLSTGTTTGAAVAATADTANGGLNLSFTPPTGNTDTWHVVARVDSVEVQ